MKKNRLTLTVALSLWCIFISPLQYGVAASPALPNNQLKSAPIKTVVCKGKILEATMEGDLSIGEITSFVKSGDEVIVALQLNLSADSHYFGNGHNAFSTLYEKPILKMAILVQGDMPGYAYIAHYQYYNYSHTREKTWSVISEDFFYSNMWGGYSLMDFEIFFELSGFGTKFDPIIEDTFFEEGLRPLVPHQIQQADNFKLRDIYFSVVRNSNLNDKAIVIAEINEVFID